MKLILQTSLLLLAFAISAHAQWNGTNPVYFSGNVGMGTNSPSIWFGTKTFEMVDPRPVLKMTATGSNGLSTLVFTHNGVSTSEHTGEFHFNYQFNPTTNALSLFRFTAYPVGEIMALRADGNVGIGTMNPDARLAVKGTIHAQEVKVDLSVPGPDYVFEEDYNLTSLKDLEAYIALHKHLPEVPSAQEMEANGLYLKEMNMLLLKKVEELTLHLIQLEKNLEKADAQNKTLEKRITQLEK
jgi:hypothetical protein